jgi:hypothetical protein
MKNPLYSSPKTLLCHSTILIIACLCAPISVISLSIDFGLIIVGAKTTARFRLVIKFVLSCLWTVAR